MPEWRLFSIKAIREARAWAQAGGVAVHLSGNWIPPGMKRETPCAHILAPGMNDLKLVALELGMEPKWIQYPTNAYMRHLDVWSGRLATAKAKCSNSEPIIAEYVKERERRKENT